MNLITLLKVKLKITEDNQALRVRRLDPETRAMPQPRRQRCCRSVAATKLRSPE